MLTEHSQHLRPSLHLPFGDAQFLEPRVTPNEHGRRVGEHGENAVEVVMAELVVHIQDGLMLHAVLFQQSQHAARSPALRIVINGDAGLVSHSSDCSQGV